MKVYDKVRVTLEDNTEEVGMIDENLENEDFVVNGATEMGLFFNKYQENIEERMEVVNGLLEDMDIRDTEIIRVFNKIDLIEQKKFSELKLLYPNSLYMSALEGIGKEKLLESISRIIKKSMAEVELNIPYEEAQILEKVHEEGKVYEEEYQKNNIYLKALLPKTTAAKLKKYSRE